MTVRLYKCPIIRRSTYMNVRSTQNTANLISAASDSLQNLISKQFFDDAKSKDLIKIQQMISDVQNASDISINMHTTNPSDEIFLINESLPEPLLNVANKLLGRQLLNFKQLTPFEEKLWKKFGTSDIYKFLTGKRDTVPEFCSNWLTFSASPKVTIDSEKIAANLTQRLFSLCSSFSFTHTSRLQREN